jgi:hypothetical protein
MAEPPPSGHNPPVAALGRGGNRAAVHRTHSRMGREGKGNAAFEHTPAARRETAPLSEVGGVAALDKYLAQCNRTRW